ncbi:MAG: SDR family oxidoreductase [Flavobacteriaceae bacterium]|nr:SDR family oxidoreductase [Flavobacteriaceae bacterium]MBL6684873.1 SDR family oxidoreductase [Flavobacteriaceae bacterium]|tara:strand:+ start:465 stop:1250 length:786 start_codon:yes stop_codon:yes gene_type:complete
MNISLKGKSALIGGSSRGLGLAVAKQLALSGANVTLMSRNEKKLKELVEILEDKTGIKHNYLKVNFNDFDSYKKIIKSYVKKKPIDILINNTQGPVSGDINNLSIKDYQKAFDLLFKSVVFTTMLVLPSMKKNNWGRILNMTSISIKEPLSYLALSNTIRSSVATWGKTLANDVAINNITVNNILTGYFKTERIKELNIVKAKKLNISLNKVYEQMKNQVPMKRIGNPKEFAYLASFLCSDNANYITGINIPIDGGLIKSL